MIDSMIQELLEQSIVANVAEMTLKCSMIVCFALVCERLLAKRFTRQRRMVWAAAIVGCFTVSVLAISPMSWNLPLSGNPIASVLERQPDRATLDLAAAKPDASSLGAIPLTDPGNGVEMIPGQPYFETSPTTREEFVPLAIRVLAMIWMIGAGVVLIRLVIGIIRARRLVFDADVPSIELKHRIRTVSPAVGLKVLVSQQTRMPFTAGFLNPVVVLPAAAENWSSDCLRAILNHEQGHVARKDNLIQLFSTLILAVNWFNPLIWFANRRWIICRELACDQDVVNSSMPRTSYAKELVGLARSVRRPGKRPLFGSPFLKHSQLETRIMFILSSNRMIENKKTGSCLAIVLLLGSALLGPAGIYAQSQTTETNRSNEAIQDDDSVWSAEVEHQAALAKEIKAIRIDTGHGNIAVRQSRGDRLEITANVKVKRDQVAEKELVSKFEEHVIIESKDRQLVISDRHSRESSESKEPNPWQVSFTIAVPRKVFLAMAAGNGNIDVLESATSVVANAGNGSVNIKSKSIEGKVVATVGNGNVSVDLAEGAKNGGMLVCGNGKIQFQGSSKINGQFSSICNNGKVIVDGQAQKNGILHRNGAIVTTRIGTDGPTYTLTANNGDVVINRSDR